jgi:tRNA modification GTPase
LDVPLDLGGYPVLLTDTAGLRQIADQKNDPQMMIEAAGIAKGLARVRGADVTLVLFAADDLARNGPDAASLALIDARSIIVVTKQDCVAAPCPAAVFGTSSGQPVIHISVQQNSGLEVLRAAMLDRLAAVIQGFEGAVLTRARHRSALVACAAALKQAKAETAPELMSEQLRHAANALARITGRIDVEDLLDVIFRDFCIGK